MGQLQRPHWTLVSFGFLPSVQPWQGWESCTIRSICKAEPLYTISETDPATLGRRFGVEVDVPVRSPSWNDAAAHTLSGLAPHAGPQLAFRSVLLDRFFRREAPAYDVAVSTANEFDLPVPSVQYIHFPQFNLDAWEDADPGRLNGLWSRLAGLGDRRLPSDSTVLTNSSWTASIVEEIYDRQPTVLHPPVDPIENSRPWDDRENGVVVLGRLAPDKRILDAIEIVERVRQRGHDLHVHIVGSAPDSYREYVARIERVASRRSFVTFERDVSRERVKELLRSHRYGLNVKPREHFGMALAEFVAAGMIAFAPNSGGQRDVLDGRSDRLFDSLAEAPTLIEAAIEGDERPRLQRDRFGRERFQDAIREYVERTIERRSGRRHRHDRRTVQYSG